MREKLINVAEQFFKNENNKKRNTCTLVCTLDRQIHPMITYCGKAGRMWLEIRNEKRFEIFIKGKLRYLNRRWERARTGGGRCGEEEEERKMERWWEDGRPWECESRKRVMWQFLQTTSLPRSRSSSANLSPRSSTPPLAYLFLFSHHHSLLIKVLAKGFLEILFEWSQFGGQMNVDWCYRIQNVAFNHWRRSFIPSPLHLHINLHIIYTQ